MANWDPLSCLDEQPTPLSLRRIIKELTEFSVQPPAGIFIAPVEADITRVHVLMLGAPGSPYEGGFFQFFVKFPSNYPLSPPRVRFLTTDEGRVRFHPHLYECGKVCLTTLGTRGGLCDWSPAQSLSSTLVSIQALVSDYVLDSANIQYETIRVAVCDQVDAALREDAMCPPAIRQIILQSFLESYSKYEGAVKARLHMFKILKDVLFAPGGSKIAEYEKLLTRLESLKDKVQMKREAEAAAEI
ncbi:ubiquitin-conjugating enzyme E2 Z [Rhipicephalus sanguineus]|uniref:Ubiquitin-conjugating enzyme E2 Z n=1 Tax=Rhipicephalus sanguineus TaxID=34632 RepID=A0A9D4SXY3_RHISA|nr:ubiquitin-conjugating enzyme E2 Z [Rhipicephalus sanguineus]KAH7957786.1 hypothetical protein HPB52_022668 [Rhipicephalus sanguineus]